MAKIILFDTEIIPAITATFTLYPEKIGHENILKERSMVCAAWKELGKKPVYGVSVLDDPKRFKKDCGDDYHVVKTLRDAIVDADILIGHNLARFDKRQLNARLIFHGLEPLPKILIVDTLKEYRKTADFMSNRLDYLGKHLIGAGKVETSKGLWLSALKGDKKAITEMLTYCKADVRLSEDVYNKILPYMESHPHVGAVDGWDRNNTCPKCGHDQFTHNKVRYTAAGVKKLQAQCKKCHGYTTFKATTEL